MELIWLYSVCQCTLSVSLIVFSVRLCMAVSSSKTGGTQGARPQLGSVSSSLRLCLGYVGAVGGALGVPVTVLLNLRTPQCLYTCITLVCCPLLIRQFSMFLLMLLTLDAHLQHHLADRWVQKLHVSDKIWEKLESYLTSKEVSNIKIVEIITNNVIIKTEMFNMKEKS